MSEQSKCPNPCDKRKSVKLQFDADRKLIDSLTEKLKDSEAKLAMADRALYVMAVNLLRHTKCDDSIAGLIEKAMQQAREEINKQ